ncbi:MAG: metal ABC transporter permease [Lentisphaerae bacterium]|nr:metal ABC transporter permease [Lentisphaerota bacterium]
MAVTCAVFGVFVLLRRVVFISIALSECAACGIAAAALLGLSPFLGALFCCLVAVAALAHDWEQQRIPRDAVLGTIFVAASALSVLLVARSGMGLLEIKARLYGDLILAGWADCLLLAIVHLPLLLCVILLLKAILYTFLDRNAAQLMGIPVRAVEFGFFVALGLVVSAASKSGGSMLVFCYLSVVPATALMLSKRLAVVLPLAAVLAVLATLAGLTCSFHYDLPGNQCIIVAAAALFIALPALAGAIRQLRRLIAAPDRKNTPVN